MSKDISALGKSVSGECPIEQAIRDHGPLLSNERRIELIGMLASLWAEKAVSPKHPANLSLIQSVSESTPESKQLEYSYFPRVDSSSWLPMTNNDVRGIVQIPGISHVLRRPDGGAYEIHFSSPVRGHSVVQFFTWYAAEPLLRDSGVFRRPLLDEVTFVRDGRSGARNISNDVPILGVGSIDPGNDEFWLRNRSGFWVGDPGRNGGTLHRCCCAGFPDHHDGNSVAFPLLVVPNNPSTEK